MGAEDSINKLKRRKNIKKKREKDPEMGSSQVTQKDFYRDTKEDKKMKTKKKKNAPVDVGVCNVKESIDELQEICGGNKMGKKLRMNKRKNGEIARTETEECDTPNINEADERSHDNKHDDSELAEDKLQKSRKKKGKNVESINKVYEIYENDDACEQQNDSKPEDHIANSRGPNEADTRRNSKSGKSRKPGKLKKKTQLVANDTSFNNMLEKSGEDAEDEVYQMSSGDEDYSKGMKKWITQYHQSRPGLKVLQERIDDFIMAHEAQEEQARLEREAQAAEGGWTVVVHHKGRKKTTDTETGIAVGSVAQAAVLDKMEKKKKKDVGLDFYRFQKREAHRNEIMMLQSKFEQDKKRIQQMRAARKFRPY